MKKLRLLLAFLMSAIAIYSQSPQKFNFQAVVRDGSGQIISEQNVGARISILKGGIGGAAIYTETHSVATNSFGLITLEIGSGGTTDDFSAIDWGGDTYFLKLEVDASGGTAYTEVGTSQLLSVPYALHASSVNDLKKLGIKGDEAAPLDSALFEVKRSDGQTVFAVYNEGVRVYVDDNQGKSKGPKGGFAIGGFDNTKGLTYEFFRVTPDSIRMYVDEGVTKGPKGGFAIGGFNRGKGITEDFMHLTEDNYFIGYESGSNITTGLYNSFFGYRAGVMNTLGSNNVFVGNETGFSNTDGNWNIFMGNSAGHLNSSGSGNIILGDEAGYSNTDGSWNVFLGDLAGWSNTIGESNVYIGSDAGISSTIGNYNVFMGSTAGYSNTEGSSNVFMGESSGYYNTIGEGNVFMGTESGHENQVGNYNVFIGEMSGWSNVNGDDNLFIGASAGEYNSNGSYNVFLGTTAGQFNTGGIGNVFLGHEAGIQNKDGSLNVAVGPQAGYLNESGESNVFLGFQSGFYEQGSNRLYIDNGGNTWDYSLVYGEFDWGYLSFYADVEAAGQVTSTAFNVSSDKSLKTNITELSSVLDRVVKLRPVEFDWLADSGIKGATEAGRQTGLVAQEVEALFPDAVGISKRGSKTINYTHLSVIFLKAMQEQQQVIEQLKEENRILSESLRSLEGKVDLLINSTLNR